MKIDFVDAYSMENQDDDDEHTDESMHNSHDKRERIPRITTIKHYLPVHEGKLRIGFSRGYLEYHVGMCYFDNRDEEAFINLALKTCQIACIAADISRGRPISPAMSKLLTPKCMNKLSNMWKLMDEYSSDQHDTESRSAIRKFPAVPVLFNGMLVSPTHFEGVVHIIAGQTQYWVSLALELRYNKWICTYADLG